MTPTEDDPMTTNLDSTLHETDYGCEVELRLQIDGKKNNETVRLRSKIPQLPIARVF